MSIVDTLDEKEWTATYTLPPIHGETLSYQHLTEIARFLAKEWDNTETTYKSNLDVVLLTKEQYTQLLIDKERGYGIFYRLSAYV